ncbi:MAG TPA: NAD-dependent epimerase/dehydratase family protein, partial [Burkholderiales bacterium]|nr:NAD-dependent epimerase/dehydratase family protein [Burkholderiales bacterium]
MYYVVTGAAGFVGSNLIRALNERGERNILAVDNLQRSEKFANLAAVDVSDYLDKHDFLDRVREGAFDGAVDPLFHQGACSDTMESDGRYMMENNYRYSRRLLDWCQDE